MKGVRFSEYKKDVAEFLAAKVPGVEFAKIYGGMLTPQVLKTMSYPRRGLALYLTGIGGTPRSQGGYITSEVALGVVVVGRADRSSPGHSPEVEDACQVIIGLIHEGEIEVPTGGAPLNPEIREWGELASAVEDGGSDFCAWYVTWTQKLVLNTTA